MLHAFFCHLPRLLQPVQAGIGLLARALIAPGGFAQLFSVAHFIQDVVGDLKKPAQNTQRSA